jgi:glycosyltransferase involved in cell wall biosynthesis
VAAIFRSDLSLVISEAEMELLTTFYQVPRAILVSCPFLLEPNTGKISSFGERAHFISLGNFRHAPNWDAVLQLKEEIWRLIRKALPDVELHLYGAYPPPKATKLHQPQDGFLVKGWAPDARKVMAEARVCLAPLRFGAGLKGKLTEAMLCGTPSVTTEVGAEGIQGSMLWPGAVVDDAENFARKAVLLYTQEREWVASQERGGDLLRARFNRQKIGERVMDQVQEGLENLETYRAGNFVGSMLQHQSMKATQYLSQWIEAKNKNGEGAS